MDSQATEWEPEDEGTYYLDDEQGDEWYDEFDDDAAYYQEDLERPEPDTEFDVSEYDEAYPSYTDARKAQGLLANRGPSRQPVHRSFIIPGSSTLQRLWHLARARKEKGRANAKKELHLPIQ